jgi:uncharacterized membrane protein
MKEMLAGAGVGTCFSAGIVDLLTPINAVLHTVTLVVGIASGVAAALYYWRKARHLEK